MEMKRSNPFSYLHKTGLISQPMPNERRLKVSHKAIAVSGSTHGKGALGSSSVDTKGLAKRANINGNDSAKYDKLEKRTTRSMKEGGSEKELRRGHNFSGLIGLADGGGSDSKPKKTGPSKKQLANPEWSAKHSVASAKAGVKSAKKSGGDVGMAKQGLAAAKGERKTAFNTIKAARKDVKAADNKGARMAAKGVLKGAKQEAKTNFAGKYKQMQAKRKARKSGGGGTGIGDILGGGLF